MARVVESYTSRVTIDAAKGIVVKEVRKCLEFGIVEREAYWLRELAPCERTPTLIDHTGNRLTMTYAGERVERNNLPPDWEEQARFLLAELKRHGCHHNDIKPRDILVQDGKLHLIDFGWATREGEAIPADWPPKLGARFRAPDGFNDEFSLLKSLRAVLS